MPTSQYTENLGLINKQLTLGVVSKILTLGIRPTDGYYVQLVVGDNVWLFGDGQTMLFGDGQEILWG